ncbi:MAG: META domain-containing protein [Bacteroidales bacterium]|nr:META domain-containing protein [Bacteroidales bacterium]
MKSKWYKPVIFLMLVPLWFLACSTSKNTDKKSDFAALKTQEWTVCRLDTIRTALPDIHFRFSEEGKITGFTSCNRFSGTCTIKKQHITIGPISHTKMLCHETRQIENTFLQMLHLCSRWQLQNKQLLLMNDKKDTLMICNPRRQN